MNANTNTTKKYVHHGITIDRSASDHPWGPWVIHWSENNQPVYKTLRAAKRAVDAWLNDKTFLSGNGLAFGK